MTVLVDWAVIYFVINVKCIIFFIFIFLQSWLENKYSLDPGGLSDIVRGSTENRLRGISKWLRGHSGSVLGC